MSDVELVVWDFDGVLNANVVKGRFVWADRMKEDLGLDPKVFSAYLFGSGLMKDVVRGRKNLSDVVDTWLASQADAPTPDRFLDYWFEQDARPDPEVIGWMQAHTGRRVIGTNNEALRAHYIETSMGFAERVDHVFASGRLGVAKPDPGFWSAVERWAKLRPDQILLVDDNAPNIAACQKRGWQGFHFTDDTRADLPMRLGIV
ncbi:MAG: HAD-IA family hydrolase [Paracoccaceae bacterium]